MQSKPMPHQRNETAQLYVVIATLQKHVTKINNSNNNGFWNTENCGENS